MERLDQSEPFETSADAMHYSAAADGAPLGESVPDPVAHLEPAEAARVLDLAEGIDAEALAAALDEGQEDGEEADCAQCENRFTPTVLRADWCSEACERAWRNAQVSDPGAVYFAGGEERRERAMRGAAALFAYQYGAAAG